MTEAVGRLRDAPKRDNLGPGNWLEWMVCVGVWGTEMETSKVLEVSQLHTKADNGVFSRSWKRRIEFQGEKRLQLQIL